MNNKIISAAISNLVIAFGGGAVLGRAVSLIQINTFQLGSLLAFFIGTCFGLLILFSKYGQPSKYRGLVTSSLGIASSLSLLLVCQIFRSDDGLLYGSVGAFAFLLLSLRFAFWFLSRIYRSDRLGSTSPKAVPFIEGLFHLGTVLSLLSVGLGVLNLSFIEVLLLDVASQVAAALLELVSGGLLKEKESSVSSKSVQPEVKATPILHSHKLVNAMTLFSVVTVLFQVLIFYAATYSEGAGAVMLSAFYAGLACAGLLGSRFSLTFSYSSAVFGHILLKNSFKIPVLVLLAIPSVVLTALLLNLDHWSTYLIFLATFAVSLCYETYALGLIFHMGQVGAQAGVKSSVAKSFGVMAVASAISMSVLKLIQLSEVGLVVLAVALLLTALAMRAPIFSSGERELA